jgi:hypothetical protein
MLTVLTQMPVNRSERLPTSAGERLRQPGRVEEGRPPVPQWVASQFDHVRPDLERARQRLPDNRLTVLMGDWLNSRQVLQPTLRAKGIDHFEERELIEIGVAGANSPDAVFTQFPDSFATPLASLAQLAKIIWQRSCSYETISIGKLKPSCSLRFKR